MNSCNFKGILIKDPVTKRYKTKDGEVAVVTFMNLSVPRLNVNTGPKHDLLPLQASGGIALTCEKYLKKGSEIAVTCRARCTYRKSGKGWRESFHFSVMELFFADGNTRQEITDGQLVPDIDEYDDIDFSALG